MSVVIVTLDFVPTMYCKALFFSSLYASIMSLLQLHHKRLSNTEIMHEKQKKSVNVVFVPNSVPSHHLE
jgi:hypothetical protein